MAELTDSITTKVKKIAQQLCKNTQDFDDCVQIGLVRILEMSVEHPVTHVKHTESFYLEGASFKIRDYLKKERLHHEREQSNTIDLWSEDSDESI